MLHASNSLLLSFWHKNNQIRELAGGLLCCWKQWKQLNRSSSSVTKNTFPPSSVDQFLQLIFYSIKTTNLHLWLCFPFIFSLLLSVWSCNGNDGTINGEICDIFWMKICKRGELYGTLWLCQMKQPSFVRWSIFVS